MAINPNTPPPFVLSSKLMPPPVWPIPIADQVVLPPVAQGFNSGPFSPTDAAEPPGGNPPPTPTPPTFPGTGLGGQ